MLDTQGAHSEIETDQTDFEGLLPWLYARSDRLTSEYLSLENETIVHFTQIQTLQNNLQTLNKLLNETIAGSYLQSLPEAAGTSSTKMEKVSKLEDEIKTKEEELFILQSRLYINQSRVAAIEKELEGVRIAIEGHQSTEPLQYMTSVLREYFFGRISDAGAFVEERLGKYDENKPEPDQMAN